MTDNKLLFSTEEAADMLNVSRTTIYHMVKHGVLGHIRGTGIVEEGVSSSIYIPREELEKYIAARMKYGHEVTLKGERLEEATENLKKAREARSAKSRRGRKPLPLESIEGTIYALGLKNRTFNILHKAGYLTVPQVNLHDPEVAKKLACLPRFGVACWNDLERALTRDAAGRVGIV